MVDLSEAAERVAVLERFPFEDNQPNIEGPSVSVLYDAYTDYNYADKLAFDTRWTEEAGNIAQLVRILSQLNIWRSCDEMFNASLLERRHQTG